MTGKRNIYYENRFTFNETTIEYICRNTHGNKNVANRQVHFGKNRPYCSCIKGETTTKSSGPLRENDMVVLISFKF